MKLKQVKLTVHVHCEPNKTMTFLRHNEPELTPGHSTAVRRCNTQMGYKQQQRVTVAQSGGGPRPARAQRRLPPGSLV